MNRRHLIVVQAWRRFLLPGFVLGLAACKNLGKKTSAPTNTGPATPEEEEGASSADPEKTPATTQPEPSTICVAGPGNSMVLAKIPLAPERFTPELKCYGLPGRSALLVLALPKYRHGDLSEVFVVDSTGKLLAQRTINTNADVMPTHTLRPLLFENLNIGSGTKLGLVFYTSESLFFYAALPAAIQFESSFRGKPAYGLTPLSVPTDDFELYHAQACFLAEVSEAEYTVAMQSNAQVLYQANISSQYAASTELKGYVVTDLMGRELANYGETFKELFEHPYFICYRLVETKAASYYLRSFIKIS